MYGALLATMGSRGSAAAVSRLHDGFLRRRGTIGEDIALTRRLAAAGQLLGRAGRGSVRTYIPGPGVGLVHVEWDGDGLVCAVSLRDLKLEPSEDARRR